MPSSGLLIAMVWDGGLSASPAMSECGLSPSPPLSKARKRKLRKQRKLQEIAELGPAAKNYVADPTRRILQGRACRRRRAQWAAHEPGIVEEAPCEHGNASSMLVWLHSCGFALLAL